MNKINIGISSRLYQNQFEIRDSISIEWYKFIKIISDKKINFIILPNIGKEISSYIKNNNINRLILSGGEDIGIYKNRDITEREIIKYSLKYKIPLIGICRGMQFIYKYFGGNLVKLKNNSHVRKSHKVLIDGKEIMVNSYHNYVIEKKNFKKKFKTIALSKDNFIEAFKLTDYPIYGIMWHPERQKKIKTFDKKFFEKFLYEKKF